MSKRPSTAPSFSNLNSKSSIIRSTHSSSIIQKQYRTSLNRIQRPGSSRNLYRSSRDIRDFTSQLLKDVLPQKFKPLTAGGMNFNDSQQFSNMFAINQLQLQSTNRSMRQTTQLNKFNLTSSKKKKKKHNRDTMTPYEKYTLMDHVHDLFFEMKRKEELKRNWVDKQNKLNHQIEIEEDLRLRTLNDCLFQFPSNLHLILTRAESNWMQNAKHIIKFYDQQIRQVQLKRNKIDEYYSTSRSRKLKNNVIKLTKKLARLRSKTNRHLLSLGFDHADMIEISEQVTEFDKMMDDICAIESILNSVTNKLTIVEKEVDMAHLIRNNHCDALEVLQMDLQRAMEDKIDQNEQDTFDEIQDFCQLNDQETI